MDLMNMNDTDVFNVILLIIIGAVIYKIYCIFNKEKTLKTQIKKKNIKYIHDKKRTIKEPFNRIDDQKYADDILDDLITWDNDSFNTVIAPAINTVLLDQQFHADYRDIMTAIINLIPDRRQRFNLPNEPIVYSEPQTKEVKYLIQDFIRTLNNNIILEVPACRTPNSGWHEVIEDPNTMSGWEKVQLELGLQPSLYKKPAKNALVKLITIRNVQKYETEDEIRYVVEFIVQKDGVTDQMILKGSFVQDKLPLRDENNFHVDRNIEMKIIIEDIFTLGYLSNKGQDMSKNFDNEHKKYYDYNKLEYNNMTDPKYIQRILMEKYRQRTFEMEHRNAMLDEEGQDFHKSLPHIYDYSNIQATQTIFDDFNHSKHFS